MGTGKANGNGNGNGASHGNGSGNGNGNSASRQAPRRRFARREDLGLSPREFATLERLDTPPKVQAYLSAIPINHEIGGEKRAAGQGRSLAPRRRRRALAMP